MDLSCSPYLQEFRLEAQTPVWQYRWQDAVLVKKVLMPHLQNTVLIQYQLRAKSPVQLQLRPFFTFRMHDAALGTPPEWPFGVLIQSMRYEIHPFEGAPILRFCIQPASGYFVSRAETRKNVRYRTEKARGYDSCEDLQSPGHLCQQLEPEVGRLERDPRSDVVDHVPDVDGRH